MSSDYRKRKSRWERFDRLFELSKSDQKKFYDQKNLIFLEEFVSIELNDFTLPDIDNAQDFSEILEILKINYRQWNQRLMGLMVTHYELHDSASEQDLLEFM